MEAVEKVMAKEAGMDVFGCVAMALARAKVRVGEVAEVRGAHGSRHHTFFKFLLHSIVPSLEAFETPNTIGCAMGLREAFSLDDVPVC